MLLREYPVNRFQPGWLPSTLVLLLLPLLVWLGFWQLSRAEEKHSLLVSYEARRQADPLPLELLAGQADPAYVRVRLSGYFDTRHSLLLDSRIRAGQAGVELLQPFFDQSSGLWVMLNRGWLAWPDRRLSPQFSTPEMPLSLHAWVYVQPGADLVLKKTPAQGWPQLVNQANATLLWQQLGRRGLPWELRIEPGPLAYRADWPVVAMGSEKHLGYAVQWFAMALALLVLFIYLGLHNARERTHEQHAQQPEQRG
jgi:cytochrome oxidase assembly protein ShyY1